MGFSTNKIFKQPKTMARFVQKRKEHVGLAPDDLSFRTGIELLFF